MKLEPTEAQRKAIIGFLSRPYPHYDPYKPDYEGWLDAFLAAANSIPEGPPVDTIARRPDGAWIAFVEPAQPGVWRYRQLLAAGQGFPEGRDADSWPVIFTPGEAVGSGPTTDGGETYDPREPSREELREYFHQDLAEHCQADDPDEYPDEYHEGDKPRLERLMREPSVFDADPHGTVNLDGTLPTFTPDPTAQQVPETCRICNGSGVGYGKVPGGWLETDCAACDATGEAQQEPVTARFSGVFTGTCMACQREQCDCHDNNDTPKPRTPRVVDRLGADDQGSRWVNGEGVTYWFEDDRWYNQAEDEDTPFEFSVGYAPASEAPYTEIVEPRELPSLDCEEARDGTEWESSDDPDFHYRFHGGQWEVKLLAREWDVCPNPEINTVEFGPYTEVLPDVG
ncbi:hypothetical protein ACM0BB_22060 [Mycobacteroides abscessus subsp. abscessus]|uniref:hypothetical protein n=1 Tax=Mycobacteroides abscessus TaxID=36809 RepID=UPI002A3B6353|nr:hypothetical protein [Mycobacteroides abscessus]MDM1867698.1 hypothetical protein [Mycobacteroides abscessus]MDM1872918.1 hypothetical protein [Mycobacteroides abscessus]MDM1877726.1 hypothetical protein [Mycobacteroides abscessus]MDM1883445.1 hypothetical protein [Mycobacteroides abscessus]